MDDSPSTPQIAGAPFALERALQRRKIVEWLLPILERGSATTESKVLSVGCGLGEDVAALREAGFACWGLEPAPKGALPSGGPYALGDGRELPFRSAMFDVVLCIEVIEHVGTENVRPARPESIRDEDIEAARLECARELVRVLRPNGLIVLTTPNRRFPVDYGHATTLGTVRVHSPFHDFLVSFGELERWFIKECGCAAVELLPMTRFYGFVPEQPLWVRCAKPLFRVAEVCLNVARSRFLARSFFCPHLALLIRR